MSVIFRGNGTATSSIAINTTTVKDTIPNAAIFTEMPNTARVVGDGSFDYKYRRGKPKISFSLEWALMPKDELKTLQELWQTVESHHWFTVQTTDLSDGTTANPIKNELFNTIAGTTAFIQGSYDGVNPMPGTGVNWIVISKWVIWTVGANAGIKKRAINFFSTGQIQMEDSLTVANGDKFFIGYPISFVSPLRVWQMGNIRSHYNVGVDCETVVF